MKLLACTLMILAAACVARVCASGPAPKLVCPICKKVIAEKQFTTGMMQNGKVVTIHYYHAYDYNRDKTMQALREIQIEMRKGK